MSFTPITIFGASDDLIEIEGDAKGCDEYTATEGTFIAYCSGGETVRFTVRFTPRGVWGIEFEPVDEDIPMPAITVSSDGYTPTAKIGEVSHLVREMPTP